MMERSILKEKYLEGWWGAMRAHHCMNCNICVCNMHPSHREVHAKVKVDHTMQPFLVPSPPCLVDPNGCDS